LQDLLCGKSPVSKEFKTNIRQYNAAFAFTSLDVKVDHAVTHASGPYSFRIQGDLHHLSGALLPPPGEPAVFAQLYIHDPASQLQFCEERNGNLNSVIMTELQAMLNNTHPYVPLYKQAFQIMREKPANEQQNISIWLRAERNQDLHRYNLPTANDEVAAIIPGDGSEEQSDHRDIVLRLNGGGLKRISHLHPSYSSLHYVLLFPHGEDGWHTDIPAHQSADRTRRAPNVSERCYHAYRLHPRPGEQPPLLWGGNLLQEYVVDAWASVEQSTLNWIRHHQKEIRADVYSGLRDAAMGDRDENINLENHGSRMVLPSSHIGSERHMNQLFQDSMAICRAFNKLDLFITMTANPNWPDIQNSLLQKEPSGAGPDAHRHKQTASDRPDIVAHVFEAKKNALIKDVKSGVFGKVAAHIHTIEFQKRGLPHMHLLAFLDPADRIHDAHDINSIVSAQIPDPVT
jgi:Helitron helicase-like domain at N-terminus